MSSFTKRGFTIQLSVFQERDLLSWSQGGAAVGHEEGPPNRGTC